MPLMMRLQFQLAMLMLACCILAGCHAAPPVKRDVLVGNYVYESEDPEGKPADHEFDHLTLQADGSTISFKEGRQSLGLKPLGHGQYGMVAATGHEFCWINRVIRFKSRAARLGY